MHACEVREMLSSDSRALLWVRALNYVVTELERGPAACQPPEIGDPSDRGVAVPLQKDSQYLQL